jgi:hypothetical protein
MQTGAVSYSPPAECRRERTKTVLETVGISDNPILARKVKLEKQAASDFNLRDACPQLHSWVFGSKAEIRHATVL